MKSHNTDASEYLEHIGPTIELLAISEIKTESSVFARRHLGNSVNKPHTTPHKIALDNRERPCKIPEKLGVFGNRTSCLPSRWLGFESLPPLRQANTRNGSRDAIRAKS